MRSLSFSPSNARLATARDDSTVRVWTFPEGREEHVLPGRVSDIKCFEWHSTMSLFVSDGKVDLLKFSGPALEPGSRCCMYLMFRLVTNNKHIDVISSSHRHKNATQALACALHFFFFLKAIYFSIYSY